LTDRHRTIRKKLRDDLLHYAFNCLKIRAESGASEPLTFNQAQRFIHEKLEAQRTATGKVRALILKGRQLGVSTYVGGRFYHRTTHSNGLRAFILTHEDAATQNLFEMVNRFHEHCPTDVRPSTGAANAKELNFDLLDSGYKIGTAGTKGVGRSSTIQLFHGSEVAFWPHAETHAAGILQAVPDEPGTEAILESTANGIGNFFHQTWREAESGQNEYIAIFCPWWWKKKYRRLVTPDFRLDDEETEYAALFGLDNEQMAWRRAKIGELKDPILFKQEYPATAAEAFQLSGHDSYILPALVAAARKATHEGIGPLVIGADPARFGNDKFALAWRKGRKVSKIESKKNLDTVQGANWIKQVIDADKPARVFVDVGGIGAGVVDILRSWGAPYEDIVVPVNFGGEPMEPEEILPGGEKRAGPRNRRAEMWKRSKEWLAEPGGADIPDSDSLQADACGPTYRYDVNQRLLLEAKEHMRARGVQSPDEWDAVVLTFAEPVHDEERPRRYDRGPAFIGSWMS
jgi:hypothetical protein